MSSLNVSGNSQAMIWSDSDSDSEVTAAASSSENKPAMNLLDLPDEVMLEIFRHLGGADFSNCRGGGLLVSSPKSTSNKFFDLV